MPQLTDGPSDAFQTANAEIGQYTKCGGREVNVVEGTAVAFVYDSRSDGFSLVFENIKTRGTRNGTARTHN